MISDSNVSVNIVLMLYILSQSYDHVYIDTDSIILPQSPQLRKIIEHLNTTMKKGEQ